MFIHVWVSFTLIAGGLPSYSQGGWLLAAPGSHDSSLACQWKASFLSIYDYINMEKTGLAGSGVHMDQ